MPSLFAGTFIRTHPWNRGLSTGLLNFVLLDAVIHSKSPAIYDGLLLASIGTLIVHAMLTPRVWWPGAGWLPILMQALEFAGAAFPGCLAFINMASGEPRILYPYGLASGIQRDATFTFGAIIVSLLVILPALHGISMCKQEPRKLAPGSSLHFRIVDILLFNALSAAYLLAAA